MNKKKLLQTIKDLPENFSIDELLDRIIFIQKIEAGLEQSSHGKSVSTREAKINLKKWLK